MLIFFAIGVEKLTLFLKTKCKEKVNLSPKLSFGTATDLYVNGHRYLWLPLQL